MRLTVVADIHGSWKVFADQSLEVGEALRTKNESGAPKHYLVVAWFQFDEYSPLAVSECITTNRSEKLERFLWIFREAFLGQINSQKIADYLSLEPPLPTYNHLEEKHAKAHDADEVCYPPSGHTKGCLTLFFDVETTGVNQKSGHIVQLAWVLATPSGQIVSQGNEIVRPEGYLIPISATNIHGITTAHAREVGQKIEKILSKFSDDADRADVVVAHNISFDQAFLERAYDQNGMQSPIKYKTQICTMRTSTQWCRLPKVNGRPGFKYPKLEELYYRLFGEDFENAHDAMSDTLACMRAYFELVKKQVITPPNFL